MSRPTGKPVASRPSQPNINKPNIAGPATRPGVDKPGPGNRPGPGAGNRPDAGNRPGIAGNDRPSAGQLHDFLDLPGERPSNKLPNNRPGVDKRPAIADRPGIDKRPGDRKDNINAIRDKYANMDRRPFDRGDWWSGHHGDYGWHWHGNWGHFSNNWCWRPCAWAALGTWFAWGGWSEPYAYDYGSSVVYADDGVYVGDKQVATQEEYYEQADTIAEAIPKVEDEKKVEWMPLGVFAISEEGAEDTGMLLQLAVSKEGIIAGTYYNELTKSERPVQGTVDRKTQRAAWKFADGKNPDLVMETGIVNLTKDESTALVHYGEDKTQTWTFIRLPAPEEAKKDEPKK